MTLVTRTKALRAAAALAFGCAVLSCGSTKSTSPLPAGPASGDLPDAGATNAAAFDAGDDVTATEDGAAPALAPGTLARGQQIPTGIAVDATNVYWLNLGAPTALGRSLSYADGQVMTCPIHGCAGGPAVLASGVSAPWYSVQLAVGPANVYFIVNSHVAFCPLGGCAGGAPTIVTPEQPGRVTSIGRDVSNLYWTLDDVGSNSGGQINACPLADCAANATPLALSTVMPADSTSVASDATDAYWSDGTGVIQRTASGGSGGARTTVWIGDSGTFSLALDADNLYWAQSLPDARGAIMQCPKRGCAAGATVIAGSRSNPSSIAVDATGVYWIEGHAVNRCPIGGGPVTPVARFDGAPVSFVLDATNVYATVSANDPEQGLVVVTAKGP